MASKKSWSLASLATPRPLSSPSAAQLKDAVRRNRESMAGSLREFAGMATFFFPWAFAPWPLAVGGCGAVFPMRRCRSFRSARVPRRRAWFGRVRRGRRRVQSRCLFSGRWDRRCTARYVSPPWALGACWRRSAAVGGAGGGGAGGGGPCVLGCGDGRVNPQRAGRDGFSYQG